MSGVAIGVDLGHGAVRAVAVDETGTILARANRRRTGGALARTAAAVVQAVLKSGKLSTPVAGIAACDPADEDVGKAVSALAGIVKVGGEINRTGLAAVVAESWIGAAKGVDTAVSLVIGDSVCAGVLIGGQPWRGAHQQAGSAAWLAINPVERQDYRKYGSLDAEISARGIARRLVWRVEAGDRSAVLEKAGALEAITAEHVFEGARSRDGVAISVVRDTAKYIGMAIANLICTIDPEVVVLSGEVVHAGDLLLEPVRQECVRRLSPRLAESLRLEISPIGDDAPAIGAARLMLT